MEKDCNNCSYGLHCNFEVLKARNFTPCSEFEWDGVVCDINGHEILEGDTVAWHDPERGYVGEFDVEGRPTEEVVKIKNLFSEAEVPPEELEVINKQ